MSMLLNEPAQKALSTMKGWLAGPLRARQGAKIARLAGLLAGEKGAAEIGLDDVLEAGRFVLHPGYAPRIATLLPTAGANRDAAKAQYLNLEAYCAAPRTVKRWEVAAGKPAKPPSEMKVLAMTSSSRSGSNSTALVMEAVRGVASLGASTEVVDLSKLKIEPCANRLIQRDYLVCREALPGLRVEYCAASRECLDANRRGTCEVKDNMPAMYQKLLACDALILGFPIYNGYEPAILSAFIERWARYEGCLFGSFKPGRRAMVIGAWGFNDPDCYQHVMDNQMNKLNMRGFDVVEGLNVCNTIGMLSGLDENGDAIVRRFPAEMVKAFEAGKTLVSGTR